MGGEKRKGKEREDVGGGSRGGLVSEWSGVGEALTSVPVLANTLSAS